MRYLFATLIFLSVFAACRPVEAQAGRKESEGRRIVQEAYAFQNKLLDSTATMDEVIQKWSATAANPAVRKDPDAQAIAYGCEALLEIQKGENKKADSLLKRALPLFRIRESKAPVLVTYAEFERGLHHNAQAMRAYEEIVKTMDSIPGLDDIPFYHASGYAPYAYAVDASFGMAQIAMSDSSERKQAIELLTNTLKLHPDDALGLMDLAALHRLHKISDENYKFKVDLLCSRKPELRKVDDHFEKKFAETGKEAR
ncbi:MAG TPA: hypothetical protein VFX22_10700 [Candidatus Kapabacteria bacterium]|nr:hypothetical protein [Candidatus Kapabacteria bacterium]